MSRPLAKRAMRVSRGGLDFLKRWEGLETRAYRDIANVLTIGYGHTQGFRDGRFDENSEISAIEAETLLREDLTPREERVNRVVEIDLHQNAFDALVSFEFNTGGLARSTALRRLNAGNAVGAAEALTWWNKASLGDSKVVIPGLSRRRAAEANLFLTPPKRSISPSGR
ncbi:MAG: lysozyme [Pseudomonadota bacterium]